MLTFKPEQGFPLKGFNSGDAICMDRYDMLDYDRIVPPLPGVAVITRLPGKGIFLFNSYKKERKYQHF